LMEAGFCFVVVRFTPGVVVTSGGLFHAASDVIEPTL
jgi:hypothetical protein